jgi:hypothetical protein
MIVRLEQTWWWTASRWINAALLGDPSEPFCSRAWRHQWLGFADWMQVAFRDPCHCEAVHVRWLDLSS